MCVRRLKVVIRTLFHFLHVLFYKNDRFHCYISVRMYLLWFFFFFKYIVTDHVIGENSVGLCRLIFFLPELHWMPRYLSTLCAQDDVVAVAAAG